MNPLKIDILVLNQLDVQPIYQQAQNFFTNYTGLELNLSFKTELILLPIIAETNYSHLDFEEETKLFSVNESALKQIIYNSQIYQSSPPFLSCALQTPQGTEQYSQVMGLAWTEPLHEWCHSWYAWFGLEDHTHAYLYALSDSHPGQVTA